MTPMWVRFTTLHGPTSFNEDGHWLGQSAIFWGGMMGFASLLIVIGINGHRALLEAVGRSARIGFWLVLISGFGVPALADIAFRAAVPPRTHASRGDRPRPSRSSPSARPGSADPCRVALLVTGLLLSAAFLMNLVPQEDARSVRVVSVVRHPLERALRPRLGRLRRPSLARHPAAEPTPPPVPEVAEQPRRRIRPHVRIVPGALSVGEPTPVPTGPLLLRDAQLKMSRASRPAKPASGDEPNVRAREEPACPRDPTPRESFPKLGPSLPSHT